MAFFSVLATIVVGFLSAVYLYSKWRYSYWKRKGVVQLEPEFFYGNARPIIKGEISMSETYLDHYKNFKKLGVKYGGLYTLFKGQFIPVDPGLIKDIMQKNFECFSAHNPVLRNPPIFRRGLLHLRGDPWRYARRKLSPSFTSGKMKMMFETLLEKSTGLDELAGEIALSGKAANIKDILGRFTIDVIGSCGFGIECNSLKNPDSEFLKYGKMIFEPPNKNQNKLLGLLLRVLSGGRLQKDTRDMENFFKKIVIDTIEFREKNKLFRKDFMHLMIQLKNRGIITDDDDQVFNKIDKPENTFSIEEITAQCMLFFIAGYETSATTMTFALLELSRDQDIQEKVRQEAKAILAKHNGNISYESLMELTYTEKVIQETLRKYPPIAVIPRVCTKNYIIPGTDTVIEKNTSTFIPAWGLHMDPEYFPNPEKFDPERFNEENKKKIKDFTYLPFGEGPRMCLGLRFGMMQSKVGLISLIKNYKFTLSENTSFPLKMQRDSIITAVDGDVWLHIEKV